MNVYTELIRHGGNQRLFQAVEMSLLAMQVDRPLHIHAEGQRGTGKTTVLRAARELLPHIQRISGCRYNCHPLQPHCPDHFRLSPKEIEHLGVENIPMPFLEICHGIKMDTLTGSIDVERLTDTLHPTACIKPGSIARSNRGIIFIDNINQMVDDSPDLAKILLDLTGAKSGWVCIEEDGLPTVQIPVEVAVWAASDPHDGPGPLEQVHSELSNRFDMVTRMDRPTEIDVVQQVLQQSQGFRLNPRRIICADPAAELRRQRQKFQAVAAVFDQVRMSEMIKNIIANIYLDFGLQSLRILEAMELGSRLHAGLQNRRQVRIEDLVAIVPLVLAHRVNMATLEEVLKYLDDAHFSHSIPVVPEKLENNPDPRMIT